MKKLVLALAFLSFGPLAHAISIHVTYEATAVAVEPDPFGFYDVVPGDFFTGTFWFDTDDIGSEEFISSTHVFDTDAGNDFARV